jgi:putative copper resistance protein D
VNETWLLPNARGLHVAGLMLAFGVSLGRQVVGESAATRPRNVELIRSGALLSVLAGGAWFAMETMNMAGAGDLAALARAAPLAAGGTRFGRLLLFRLALVTLAALWAGKLADSWRARIAAVFAGGALGLQAWTGHAWALGGAQRASLAGIETAHLLAAGAWLGGLPMLFATVSASSRAAAELAARRFSPLGMMCVATIAATAFAQAVALIGGRAALFGTAYGRIALLKVALFAALLLLAKLNRFFLIGRRRQLRLSIAAEMALGLAVTIAAAFLAQSIPGAHHAAAPPD